MRKLIYSMSVTLDGCIAGRAGEIDWSGPDLELHQFHNDRVRDLGVHLLGRRLYETMTYWDTADQDPSLGPVELAFARIWQALPKVVFSNTLKEVTGNARLAEAGVGEEVARLKQQQDRDLAVGGATLAADCARLGLIDEYQVFVSPVILGGGTPYLPPLKERIELELRETRTFASRNFYLRYGRV